MSGPDTKYRKEAPTAITTIITTTIASICSIMTTIIAIIPTIGIFYNGDILGLHMYIAEGHSLERKVRNPGNSCRSRRGVEMATQG